MTNYEGNLQNFRDVLICQEIYHYWKILITHFLDGIFEWINIPWDMAGTQNADMYLKL